MADFFPKTGNHAMNSANFGAKVGRLATNRVLSDRLLGVDEEEQTETASPRGSWARLLQRVFTVDMARCPWCQEGTLRLIAAITHGEVIRKILCHLKLAADPPPIAPARIRQEAFAWFSP